MLTLDKIYHASYVLKDVIRQTNIVQARGICDDCDVYLKPENLQITGSFKVSIPITSFSIFIHCLF